MKLSIAHLRAAGIGDKLILDAIAEVEAEQREKARIRQRNHRSRNGSNGDTRDMRDMRDTNIEERKKEEEGSKFIARKNARTKKPMIPLPENWHPELAGDIEFEKFSDHARQNDRHCADWEAAWRNWNRNKPQFNKRGQNGNGRRHGSVLDAADRLIEKLGGEEAARRYVPGSEGPRPLDLDKYGRPTNLKLIPKG